MPQEGGQDPGGPLSPQNKHLDRGTTTPGVWIPGLSLPGFRSWILILRFPFPRSRSRIPCGTSGSSGRDFPPPTPGESGGVVQTATHGAADPVGQSRGARGWFYPPTPARAVGAGFGYPGIGQDPSPVLGSPRPLGTRAVTPGDMSWVSPPARGSWRCPLTPPPPVPGVTQWAGAPKRGKTHKNVKMWSDRFPSCDVGLGGWEGGQRGIRGHRGGDRTPGMGSGPPGWGWGPHSVPQAGRARGYPPPLVLFGGAEAAQPPGVPSRPCSDVRP